MAVGANRAQPRPRVERHVRSVGVELLAMVSAPEGVPTTELPAHALGFRVQNYGLRRHRDLFSARQLLLLSTLSTLVSAAHNKALDDTGGDSERAVAIAIYLALAVT